MEPDKAKRPGNESGEFVPGIQPRPGLKLGLRTCSLIGIGAYLPKRVVTNAEIGLSLGEDGGWIYHRTGIRERRRAALSEFTSDLATHAAANALANAGVNASDVDLILVATNTPDMTFPATACMVQAKLGAGRCAAFDLKGGGAGFVYALSVGRQFVISRTYDTVMVIGSEKLSTVIDGKDRSTCALFGDGAGAAILQHQPGDPGILCVHLQSDGEKADLIQLPAGGCRMPASFSSIAGRAHFLRMSGYGTFKQAVLAMCAAAQEALRQSGLTLAEVACILPHQSTRRLVKAFSRRMGASSAQVFMNLEYTGNTSAASIPVALAGAVTTERIRRGDYVLLVGFGSGLTSGAAVVKW